MIMLFYTPVFAATDLQAMVEPPSSFSHLFLNPVAFTGKIVGQHRKPTKMVKVAD